MLASGTGSKVNVQVPSPLSVATGPAFGSHDHHGPVIRTLFAFALTPFTVMARGWAEAIAAIIANIKKWISFIYLYLGSFYSNKNQL